MEVSDDGMLAEQFASEVYDKAVEFALGGNQARLSLKSGYLSYKADQQDDAEAFIFRSVMDVIGEPIRSPDFRCEIDTGHHVWEFRPSLLADESIRLDFEDGSWVDLGPLDDEAVLDTGAALLEPITQTEHRAIENLLGVLVVAAARDELTEPQQKLILTIADLIREERRDTTPDETARGGLVAVVRRGFKMFMSGDDVVKNALAWSQVIEILYEIGWRVTAKQLGG